jgi:hypothetical protein
MTYPTPTTEPATDPHSPSQTGDVLRDVGVVLGWFLVAGVLGALVWWKVVDLPQWTRTSGGVAVEADQLGKQVNIDGWFFVIAIVGGLVSGIVLTLWRRRDTLLIVVLVTLGGGLASVVMQRLGKILGPGSEVDALRHKPIGAHAPMQLEIHASGVLWVWPAAAAFGALVYLWVLKTPENE